MCWLAAGTLRHADFDEMSRRAWRTYNDSADAMFSGLCAPEREAYSRFVRAGDRVLLVGCGSGRDLFRFVDAGHDVVGVEPSPAPVALLRRALEARRVHQSVRVIEGFIEHVTVPGMFDVIVFSGLCYGFVRESSRRVELLKALRRQLNRDGRVIITYIPSPPGRRSRAIRLGRATAWLTGSDWTPEPNDVLVQTRDANGQRLLLYEHWFARAEIEAEAQQAGSSILAHWSPEGAPTLVLGT